LKSSNLDALKAITDTSEALYKPDYGCTTAASEIAGLNGMNYYCCGILYWFLQVQCFTDEENRPQFG
jgi:hypothetical protein